jgi:hypothetical protein
LSTYTYSLTSNLIGDYSLDDNFLVDHICITCDRINELKLVVFRPICYVSQSFCCGTLDYVRDNMKIHSGLVDILQPAKGHLSMLTYCHPARIESDFHTRPNTCCIYMLLKYTSLIFANCVVSSAL